MARQQQAPLRRFERMSRLKGYTVEKGLTDPRGWAVVDGASQEIGQVKDLVIDTDRMAVAYLEVELDSRSFAHEDPLILVPIARAERDSSHDRLVVTDLSRSRIAALFDARAAHEVGFWERWWRDPAAEEHITFEVRDERTPRPAPGAVDTVDIGRPRDVMPAPAPSRIEREQIAALDSDERRQGLPADTPPGYSGEDRFSERDPLEDPQYRRPPVPGERRRFDE